MQKKVIHVQFSLLEDLRTFIKYFETEFNKVEKEGNELGKKLADAIKQQRLFESHIQKLTNEKKQAISSISQYEKAAKNIGLDANTPEIKKLQSLIDNIGEYEKLSNSVGKIPQL